ncbi:MAG: flavin reductase family protein [Thaumarchaeota archaeon]|nr:flavin reductase family protein [Nitrososphaerota archaeon]
MAIGRNLWVSKFFSQPFRHLEQLSDMIKIKEISPEKAYRLFYPNVVALLSASFKDDADVMPVISYCSLSFEPPLFGVAINPKSFTYRLVKRSGCLAFNIVNDDMSRAVAASGDISAKDRRDKLLLAGISLVKARKIKGKVVKDASAVIECAVLKAIKTGDHDFFIGKCETSYANDDFRDYWEYKKYSPALYAGSHKGDRGKSHRFAKLAREFNHIPYISS